MQRPHWLLLTMERLGRDIKIFPQHEEMLSEFKARLKNQVYFASLKTLCARKLIKCWPSVPGGKLSSVLPKTLCSFVYQEFLEPQKDKLNIACMRLGWRLYQIDIEVRLLRFADDGLEELDCSILRMDKEVKNDYYYPNKLFRRLAEGSPNLRSLKHKNHIGDAFENFPGKLLLSEYYSLRTMSNLVILELNLYSVEVADLQVIGLCLPLLQRLFLKFGSNFISIEGLEFLTNLKALKHLTIELHNVDHIESVLLVKNCLQLMPQVNVVGTSNRELLFVRHEFPSYECPIQLGLEHLVLGAETVIPSNVTLPKVNKITVDKTLNIPLRQFKKLEDLSCMALPWSQLEQALAEVGHLLKKLKLSSQENCRLPQVLHLCPTLEELQFIAVDIPADFNPSQLQFLVKNLKIFKHGVDDTNDKDNIIDSCGLLHLLLTSCPDLEELTFSGIRLTKEEIRLMSKDMKGGALAIQKLQKVHIMAAVEEEDYVRFAKFAWNLCAHNYKIFRKVYIWLWLEGRVVVPELNLALKAQYYINNKYGLVLRYDSHFQI